MCRNAGLTVKNTVNGQGHYRDQADMYVHGEFRKMMMNKKEIEETSTKLVLEPK